MAKKKGGQQDGLEYISEGMYRLWRGVDDVCGRMGWVWTKESPGRTFCEIHAFPQGTTETRVAIFYDSSLGGAVDDILNRNPRIVKEILPNAHPKNEIVKTEMFIKAMEEALIRLQWLPPTPHKYWSNSFPNLLIAANPDIPPVRLAAAVTGPAAYSPTEDRGMELWEMIPDNKWDRAAVKGLCEHKTDPEIAAHLGVDAKTVTNRLSVLRQLYPDCVPTRSDLRKRKILG